MRILNHLYLFSIAIFLNHFLIADDKNTIYTSSGITTGVERKGS